MMRASPEACFQKKPLAWKKPFFTEASRGVILHEHKLITSRRVNWMVPCDKVVKVPKLRRSTDLAGVTIDVAVGARFNFPKLVALRRFLILSEQASLLCVASCSQKPEVCVKHSGKTGCRFKTKKCVSSWLLSVFSYQSPGCDNSKHWRKLSSLDN